MTVLALHQYDTFLISIQNKPLHTSTHAGTDAQTLHKLDIDKLEIVLFTPLVFSQVTTVIWPGFQWCVCGAACVFASLHCTGGGQQGREQASEQVEYHWGGNNTVWSPPLLEEAWREMLQVVLTAHCCSPCAGQILIEGASVWRCISGHNTHVLPSLQAHWNTICRMWYVEYRLNTKNHCSGPLNRWLMLKYNYFGINYW